MSQNVNFNYTIYSQQNISKQIKTYQNLTLDVALRTARMRFQELIEPIEAALVWKAHWEEDLPASAVILQFFQFPQR